ncbi:MAG: hypothetical protein FWC11_03155 [Firmicutes bacterium]|nr:hypothetical protein [Bacillota bacterium]
MEKEKKFVLTGKETLAQLEDGLKLLTEESTAAIKSGKLTDEMVASLLAWETACANKQTDVTYRALGKKEKPMVEASILFKFPVKKVTVKRDKDTQKIVEVKLGEYDKKIDIKDFCTTNKLSLDWLPEIQFFKQTMILKVAYDRKMTPAQLKEISKSYYMDKKIAHLAEGRTPFSNNSVCKDLQRLVDAIVPFEGYKCHNEDFGFIRDCMTQMGKEPRSTRLVGDKAIMIAVLNLLNKFATKRAYNVDYRKIKVKTEKTAPAPQSKAPKKKSGKTSAIVQKQKRTRNKSKLTLLANDDILKQPLEIKQVDMSDLRLDIAA